MSIIRLFFLCFIGIPLFGTLVLVLVDWIGSRKILRNTTSVKWAKRPPQVSNIPVGSRRPLTKKEQVTLQKCNQKLQLSRAALSDSDGKTRQQSTAGESAIMERLAKYAAQE